MNPAIRLLTVAGLAVGLLTSPAMADDMIVGLITKTDTNPFFVRIREEAFKRAEELGIELRPFAGNHGGDTATQVEAIESLVALGATGILITPSDPEALTDTVKAARDAGLLVIALDTPFDPADTVDATFANDNFKAGELIGMWARARMGDAAKEAKIATLNGTEAQTTVDVLRNQGFLKGFGVDIKDPETMHDEDDPRIVGSDTTLGSQEGGRVAMEKLVRQDPDINLVYAINEPAAAGAYEVLKALGMENNVLIVSIDSGCPGIRSVGEGAIGATAMQYPLRMAALGIEAVSDFIKTGKIPENTPGLKFYDTGATLVTDQPVGGIPSISTEDGLKTCWE